MSTTLVITGCSSGLGRETALLLARQGYAVFATMRHTTTRNQAAAASLRQLAETEQLELEVVDLDVTDPISIARAVAEIGGLARPLDALINNAGYGLYGLSEAFTPNQMRQQFEVNYFGVAEVTNAFLPIFRRQGHGGIINVSSVIGRVPARFMAHYVATKYALEGYSASLDLELRPLGIRVVTVEPGLYNTGFAAGMQYPHDDARAASYGDYARVPAEHLAGFGDLMQAPDQQHPIEVAQGIEALLARPTAQWPARTLLDRMGFAPMVARINHAQDLADQDMGQLLTVV